MSEFPIHTKSLRNNHRCTIFSYSYVGGILMSSESIAMACLMYFIT
ncbi:hypothetical protein [Chlamydia abortus]